MVNFRVGIASTRGLVGIKHIGDIMVRSMHAEDKVQAQAPWGHQGTMSLQVYPAASHLRSAVPSEEFMGEGQQCAPEWPLSPRTGWPVGPGCLECPPIA